MFNKLLFSRLIQGLYKKCTNIIKQLNLQDNKLKFVNKAKTNTESPKNFIKDVTQITIKLWFYVFYSLQTIIQNQMVIRKSEIM